MLVITRGYIPSKCRCFCHCDPIIPIIPILRVRATTSRAGSATCQENMGAVWNRMEPYETSPYFNHFLGVLWLFRVLCDHFLMWTNITENHHVTNVFLDLQPISGLYGVFFGRNRLDRQKHGGEPPFHPKKLIILLCVGEPSRPLKVSMASWWVVATIASWKHMKCIQKVIQEPNTGRSFRSSHETGKDRATLKPAFCTIGTVREPLGDRGYLAVDHPETLLFTSK